MYVHVTITTISCVSTHTKIFSCTVHAFATRVLSMMITISSFMTRPSWRLTLTWLIATMQTVDVQASLANGAGCQSMREPAGPRRLDL